MRSTWARPDATASSCRNSRGRRAGGDAMRDPLAIGPRGAVLLTGASGFLGAQVARRLLACTDYHRLRPDKSRGLDERRPSPVARLVGLARAGRRHREPGAGPGRRCGAGSPGPERGRLRRTGGRSDAYRPHGGRPAGECPDRRAAEDESAGDRARAGAGAGRPGRPRAGALCPRFDRLRRGRPQRAGAGRRPDRRVRLLMRLRVQQVRGGAPGAGGPGSTCPSRCSGPA